MPGFIESREQDEGNGQAIVGVSKEDKSNKGSSEAAVQR